MSRQVFTPWGKLRADGGNIARNVPADVHSFPFKDAFAHAHTYNGKAIGLNPRWYGDPASFRAELAQAGTSGWFTPGSATIDGIFTHEWGHLIDGHYNLSKDALIPEVGIDGRGMVSHLWQTWKQQNRATRKLSVYATTAKVENISEGYAAIVGTPRSQWTNYVKELEKMLNLLTTSRLYRTGEWAYARDAADRRAAIQRVIDWFAEIKQKVKVQ